MFYAFLSTIFYSAREIIIRQLMKKDYSQDRVLMGMRMYGMFFVIVLLFANLLSDRLITGSILNISNWLLLALAIATGSIGLRLNFLSMRDLSVANSIPLVSTGPIFYAIFGMVLFKESYSFINYIGMLIILISIMLSNIISGSLKFSDLRFNFNSASLTLIFAMIMFSVSAAVYKVIATWIDVSFYIFLVYILDLVIFSPRIVYRLKKKKPVRLDLPLLLLGIVAFGGFFFNNMALEKSSFVQVEIIQEMGTVMNLFAGIFILNEQENFTKKFVITLLASLGVIFLVAL